MSDDKTTIKELSAGFHKSALAIRELSVKQASCCKITDSRLSTLENQVHAGSYSLQSRMSVLEVRVTDLEKKAEESEKKHTSLEASRISSRSTIMAAIIGGSITILIAVLSLLITLAKG